MSKNAYITVNKIFELMRRGKTRDGVDLLYNYHYNRRTIHLKKSCIATLIILIVLFSCVACNNYVEQNVVVKGWLKDSADFDLGRFMVEIETPITNEEQLGFRIKDDRTFSEVVLKHNKLLRKEYNNKQNTVYVFLNEGNYFLLISNGSKGANYILRSAVSVFTDKDGIQYFFPLYDCQIFYNGMLFFDENRTTIKTDKSWQYLLDYFNLISDKHVSIDGDTKSAIVSISTIDRQLVVNKKIKISYRSDGINHYLTVCLLLI